MTTFTQKGVTRPGAPLPRQLRYESKLLYHLRAADLLNGYDPIDNVAQALTGEAPTFSRASAGGLTRDALGYLRQWGQGVPRLEMYDLDGDGYYEEPGILLEGGRTNVCLRSEEIDNAAWTDLGTPIVTANDREAPDQAVSADKIEDDDAVTNAEGRRQTFTISNDSTTWTVSVFLRKTGATAPVIGLRCNLNGGTTKDALLVVRPDTGARLGSADVVDSGVIEYREYYRVWLTVANNTTGNVTLLLSLYPAARAAGDISTAALVGTEIGSNHFWGAQVENANFPSSYVKTVASSVAQVADALTYVLAFLGQTITEDLDDVTSYVRMPRPLHADATGSLTNAFNVYSLSSVNPRLRSAYQQASRLIDARIGESSGDVVATAAIPVGAVIEISAQYRNLRTGGSVALDVGSGLTAFSAAAAAFSTYGDTTGEVGRSGGAEIFGALFDVKVARGLRTLKQMQEAL